MKHFSIVRTLCATATLSLPALGPLALTGCDKMDPMTRPYYWNESEANKTNIAAMVANKNDLTHGRHSDRRRDIEESDAVERVWTGHATPLLTETPGSTGGSNGTGSASGSPTGGGGGT